MIKNKVLFLSEMSQKNSKAITVISHSLSDSKVPAKKGRLFWN